AARRDDGLEAARAGGVEHDAGEGGVVLDDQQHPLVRAEVLAVVLDLDLRGGGALRRGRRDARAARPRRLHLRDDAPPRAPGPLPLRQVELERAPRAGRADDRDLAAQQAGDLAADREPEAGATVAAARAAVRLLKRLEDDLLLLGVDADARVAHREDGDAAGV